jgi:hypothetical protein
MMKFGQLRSGAEEPAQRAGAVHWGGGGGGRAPAAQYEGKGRGGEGRGAAGQARSGGGGRGLGGVPGWGEQDAEDPSAAAIDEEDDADLLRAGGSSLAKTAETVAQVIDELLRGCGGDYHAVLVRDRALEHLVAYMGALESLDQANGDGHTDAMNLMSQHGAGSSAISEAQRLRLARLGRAAAKSSSSSS